VNLGRTSFVDFGWRTGFVNLGRTNFVNLGRTNFVNLGRTGFVDFGWRTGSPLR